MKRKTIKRCWPLILSLILLMPMLISCDNPFDPLDKTDEIKGLTFIDWTGNWERWDSDPEYDGFVIIMEYFNEFGDSLEIKDKAHEIKIEFYTQKEINQEIDEETGDAKEGTGVNVPDRLIFEHTTIFSNTDDSIRIPKELYIDALRGAGFDLDDDEVLVYVLVHVFPPKAIPQQELIAGYPDQIVHKPEVGPTPNP